jgi:hypothetical protein
LRPTSLAVFLLLAAAGCAGVGKERPGLLPGRPDAALLLLRERTAALRSFHAAGTFYVQTEQEKHFLHFEGWFERPDRARLSVELPGFLGIGSGRFTFIRSGGELTCFAPLEEGGERTVPADSALTFLAAFGLTPATAPYLLAPYSGPMALYAEERVVASQARPEGGTRLVLEGEEGRREVLDLDSARRLFERRVVEPGGTVHLVCSYEYADGETLFAREVKAYLPREKAHLTTRFRVLEGNIPIAPSLFAP